MLSIQVSMLTAWLAARHRLVETARAASRDERGELTGNVIFLAALAAAALAVAGIIIARLNAAANKVP